MSGQTEKSKLHLGFETVWGASPMKARAVQTRASGRNLAVASPLRVTGGSPNPAPGFKEEVQCWEGGPRLELRSKVEGFDWAGRGRGLPPTNRVSKFGDNVQVSATAPMLEQRFGIRYRIPKLQTFPTLSSYQHFRAVI